MMNLLLAQGAQNNHKRIFRLYQAAGLSVGKRRHKRGLPMASIPPAADDFSHECVELAVDFGMGGEYVVRLLEQAARFRDYPEPMRTGPGPEFTSRAFLAWTQARGIRHLLNAPGKPTRNDYNEVRPHSSIGRIPPAQFAALHRATINLTTEESFNL
jgi:putative transposase